MPKEITLLRLTLPLAMPPVYAHLAVLLEALPLETLLRHPESHPHPLEQALQPTTVLRLLLLGAANLPRAAQTRVQFRPLR